MKTKKIVTTFFNEGKKSDYQWVYPDQVAMLNKEKFYAAFKFTKGAFYWHFKQSARKVKKNHLTKHQVSQTVYRDRDYWNLGASPFHLSVVEIMSMLITISKEDSEKEVLKTLFKDGFDFITKTLKLDKSKIVITMPVVSKVYPQGKELMKNVSALLKSHGFKSTQLKPIPGLLQYRHGPYSRYKGGVMIEIFYELNKGDYLEIGTIGIITHDIKNGEIIEKDRKTYSIHFGPQRLELITEKKENIHETSTLAPLVKIVKKNAFKDKAVFNIHKKSIFQLIDSIKITLYSLIEGLIPEKTPVIGGVIQKKFINVKEITGWFNIDDKTLFKLVEGVKKHSPDQYRLSDDKYIDKWKNIYLKVDIDKKI